MKRLRQAIEAYLARTGLNKNVLLGNGEGFRAPDDNDSRFLKDRLRDARRTCRTFMWIAAVMICVLFVVGIIVLIRSTMETSLLALALGVTFVSLIGLIGRLHELGIEIYVMALMSSVLHNLPPESAVKFTLLIYLFISGKRRQNRGYGIFAVVACLAGRGQ